MTDVQRQRDISRSNRHSRSSVCQQCRGQRRRHAAHFQFKNVPLNFRQQGFAVGRREELGAFGEFAKLIRALVYQIDEVPIQSSETREQRVTSFVIGR